MTVAAVSECAKQREIRHVHFSEPAAQTPLGKSFPKRHLAAYNEILEQIVLDKTLQVQEKHDALERELAERKNIEQTLGEAEETFSSIIKSSPMGIYIYQATEDGKLIFLGANPAADRMVQVDHAKRTGSQCNRCRHAQNACTVNRRKH